MAASQNFSLSLSIPHIQDSIFRHESLSSHDLANACRVNRAWFQIVSPFLWGNITANDDVTSTWQEGFQSGIVQQGKWTRILCTSNPDILDWCTPHCTRLWTIQAGPVSKYWKIRNSLLNLVSCNPELKIFRCYGGGIEREFRFSDISPGLMNSDSRSLKTLNLKSLIVDSGLCEVLNHHFITMNQLTLSRCCVGSNTFSVLQNSRSNLKQLGLKYNWFLGDVSVDTENQIFKFLNCMTELIEFTLATSYSFLIQLFSKVLAESYEKSRGGSHGGGSDGDIHIRPLGFLRALTLEHTGRNTISEGVVQEILDSLPDSLTHLRLNDITFRRSGEIALLNFTKRNADRLTCLEFVFCEGMTNESLQTILMNCHFLIEFVSHTNSEMDVVVMNELWKCTSLERLRVFFGVGFRSLENYESQSKSDLYKVVLKDCKKIFVQLADLTRLREVKIRIGAPKQLLSKLSPDEDGNEEPEGLNDEERKATREEFLRMWSLLSTCEELGRVSIQLFLPSMIVNNEALKANSKEIWSVRANAHQH